MGFLIIFLIISFLGVINSTAIFAAGEKVFSTPEDAVNALLDACKNNDRNALISILGKDSGDMVVTGDEGLEKYRRMEFYNWAQEEKYLEKDEKGRLTLVVGITKWPFPIPLVKSGNGWCFDSTEGRDELLRRRIGMDELSAIKLCRLYVDAQREYASKDRGGSGIMEYAQKFKSTEGKHDGLYWAHTPGSDDISPLGPLVAATEEYIKGKKDEEPFFGYCFRILTAQGSNAPAGAYNYIINGHMLAGFALVAWPAEYGNSGIMTFIVNQQGRVYEKDLGEKTGEMVKSIREYDPDSSWKPVE